MKDNRNLEWEEIFANEDTHKKFISKTYKEPHTAQYQRHNNRRHKWAKHRNGCFLEEDIQIVIRHMSPSPTPHEINLQTPETPLAEGAPALCYMWERGGHCPA